MAFKDSEQTEKLPFIQVILDDIDLGVSEYLQKRLKPVPAIASSTFVDPGRMAGFPANLTEVGGVSPSQGVHRDGDGTTSRTRLSYRLQARPSQKGVDPTIHTQPSPSLGGMSPSRGKQRGGIVQMEMGFMYSFPNLARI